MSDKWSRRDPDYRAGHRRGRAQRQTERELGRAGRSSGCLLGLALLPVSLLLARREPHRPDPTQSWHDTPAYRRGYSDASGRGMDSSSAGAGGRGPGGGGGGGGCAVFLVALVPTLIAAAGLAAGAARWWTT